MQHAVLREAFDGRDLSPTASLTCMPQERVGSAIDVEQRRHRTARCRALYFGTGQADRVTDDPEQWRVRFDVHVMHFSIDRELEHLLS